MRTENLPPLVYAYGLSSRKLEILRRFSALSRIENMRSFGKVSPGSTVILWGSTPVPDDCPDGINVIRVEDGFLRSVGLGADLIKPVSWVFDTSGIYYDATRPSDLELLLEASDFTPKLLERASNFRERIVCANLTKYNVGYGSWERPAGVQRIILVPGQVETDASIRYGSQGINTNMGLLQAVREANPSAYVVYKLHPDVVAGLRAQGRDEGQALAWCNEQLTDVAIGELLPKVDEVHTMTSLTGFEALLRGKRVVCYGQPFYAGWGLTTDLMPIARRIRLLTLDELVAGTLILYPTYISRKTGRFTTPEQALGELLEWREQSGRHGTLWRQVKRMFLRRIVGVR